MKHFLKRILTATLCLLALCATFVSSASAASNVCEQTSGDSSCVTSFIVRTTSRWLFSDVLKLSQTEGVMMIMKGNYYTAPAFHENTPTGTKKMYEKYHVTVEELDDDGNVADSYERIFDEGSLKLKLNRNSVYRITVVPTFCEFEQKMTDHSYYITNPHLNPYGLEYTQGNIISRIFSSVSTSKWKPLGWETDSTWYVSTTRGIEGCSFGE
jgi:hypothetical protein